MWRSAGSNCGRSIRRKRLRQKLMLLYQRGNLTKYQTWIEMMLRLCVCVWLNCTVSTCDFVGSIFSLNLIPGILHNMIRVKQCFCGCSLKTGAEILIWLSLLKNINFLFWIVDFVFFSSFEYGALSVIAVAVLFNIIFIEMALAMMALQGINTKKPALMKPYVYCYIVNFFVILFFAMIFFPISLFQFAVALSLVILFGFAAILALYAYFIIVLYSYYKTFTEEVGRVFISPEEGVINAEQTTTPGLQSENNK